MKKLKELYIEFDKGSMLLRKCMNAKAMFWLKVAAVMAVLSGVLYWTGIGLWRPANDFGWMALGIMSFRIGEVHGARKQAESDAEFFVGHKYSDEKAEDLTLYD